MGTKPVKSLFSAQISRWIGVALTSLAVGLVVWSLYKSGLLASDAWMNADIIDGMLLALLVYTASLFCAFAAWYLLVTSVSQIEVSWREGLYIYSLSAIYRYIPSNIVHYVGRYYMLRQRGVEHAAATWGMIAETALLVSTSTIVALLFGAPLIRENLLRVVRDGWLIIAVAALVAGSVFAIAILILPRSITVRTLIGPFLRVEVFHAGIKAFLLFLVARMAFGASLYCLSALATHNQVSLPDMIAIGSAAWTLGYITPGASAGFGVREAVIIAALIGLGVPTADATLIAIAFRVSTTVADVVFTASGWTARRLAATPEVARYSR
jgi:glycosyltransferase 2 family protein